MNEPSVNWGRRRQSFRGVAPSPLTSDIYVSNAYENEQIWATMIDYKATIPFEWYKVSLYNIYKHKLPLLHVTIYIICC